MKNLIIANSYITYSLGRFLFVNLASDYIVQHLFITNHPSVSIDVKAAIAVVENECQTEDGFVIHVIMESNHLFPRQQAKEQLIGYLKRLWKYIEELLGRKKIKIHGWLLDSQTLKLCLYQIRDGSFQITTVKQFLNNKQKHGSLLYDC